jgi:transcriptional regulator with XRE-family HTH domain
MTDGERRVRTARQTSGMSTRERPADRGRRIATSDRIRAGTEIRDARLAANLSLRAMAVEARVSPAQASRIERGTLPNVSVDHISRLAAVVGLDARLRLYPGPDPLRDAGSVAAIDRFRRRLGPGLVLRTEVPLPRSGDLRALDGVIDELRGLERQMPLEVETRLNDLQGQSRRLALKIRDAGFDHWILVVSDTRHNRQVVHEAAALLRGTFPVTARVALAALREGRHPGGSAIVLV